MPIPPSSKPIMKRRLLRDEAHDAIRAAIFDGSFAPGERLDDHALQEWLGISRTPIREALNALTIEGLVETAAQSYTRVVDPDPEIVEEVVQTLGVLIGGVVRLAVPQLTDAQRVGVVALLDRAAIAIAGRDAAAHLGVAFEIYESFIEACGNRPLQKLTREAIVSMGYQIKVTIAVRVPDWGLLDSGYSDLRAALTTRDPVAAELAVERMHRLPLAGR